MDTIILDGLSLTLDQVERVARGSARAVLAEQAVSRMEDSRTVVDRCVAERLVRYGITTGFGRFSDVVISPEHNAALQRNLIRSHACGIGEPFPGEVVRAMLLLRANALAVGASGIRVSTVRSL
ncbi:MAG TPA: aromatic amino acid lyase, partial [Magnetospirillaceae bacterium]|nr:aromatic amino acid lyase [Magnetospirillaceae bacterium]